MLLISQREKVGVEKIKCAHSKEAPSPTLLFNNIVNFSVGEGWDEG